MISRLEVQSDVCHCQPYTQAAQAGDREAGVTGRGGGGGGGSGLIRGVVLCGP